MVGAGVGFVVQLFGTGMIELVRGPAEQKALRAVVKRAIESVVEQAGPSARPRLRRGLQQCFEAPRLLELDSSVEPVPAFRAAIAAQVEQLEGWVDSDTGRPYYAGIDLTPQWVRYEVTDALLRAVRHHAATTGRLAPLAQALDAADNKATLDEVRRQLAEIKQAVSVAGQAMSDADGDPSSRSALNYDLTRLDSHELGRLIQDLCSAVFGVDFTTSPDSVPGMPELPTHRGRLTWTYPGETRREWNGHTAIVEVFFADSHAPIIGLSEFKRILGALFGGLQDSKAPKPDNLLIVTNADLSHPDAEGRARFDAMVGRVAASALGPAEHQLWDRHDLRVLLDAHPAVRRKYSGLLAAGDVMGNIDAWTGHDLGGLGVALTSHAIKDMLAQQYVRLGQAGDPHEDKLALDSIAIDVPVRWDARISGRSERNAAALIIDEGRFVRRRTSDEVPQHLLVIGGPGQGKSTLAQIICQVHRVALLRNTALSAEAKRLLSRLDGHFRDIGLPVPDNLRWPVRVVLSEYAEYLAAHPDRSLLRFLAEGVSARNSETVTPARLATWLGSWPWLLVLDGMDEVVSPVIRERVSAGISAFLVDAAQADADVFVVVTTRPQGYTGEFGTEDYEHLELLDLDGEAAIAYGRRLTAARLSEDPDLQDRVNERLVQAAADPDTTRMMRTPLQVTIMALLLERRQRIPADRYQLFNAYFETIYARETNKPTELGRLLEEHRADIEAIHEVVALELQRQAETSDSDDSLPSVDLSRHVIDRLSDEGNEDEEVLALTEKLTAAATHRMVLLVPRGDNGVGFEIRSIQEYLAARALTRGESDEIFSGLRPLIPSAHWRNTWLLAAGRLFGEREDLRGSLITALLDADNEGLLPWLVRPGAALAVDLLADDLATKSPRYRRLLADQAIDRLAGLPDPSWRALATLLSQLAGQDSLIRQKVEKQINASLAAGGGARAHAILMLTAWERATGGLAARARQLLRTHGGPYLPENLGVHMYLEGLKYRGPNPTSRGPRLADHLSRYVPELEPAEDAGLRRLIDAFPQVNLWQVTADEAAVSTLVLRSDRFPEHSIAGSVFGEPRLSDAYAELVESLPPEHWHVAAYLRDVARTWYARRLAIGP